MTERVIELRPPFSRPGRRVFYRRVVVALSVLLVLVVGGFVFGLRKIEKKIAFHSMPYVPGDAWTTPSGAEDVWFTSSDGNRLHGWYFHSLTLVPQATIIHFHGNGGNITNISWIGAHLAARGFNTLVFDYRGYGHSEGVLENEEGLYADADAAYDYIARERGVPQREIVLYGHSLGTAAVADLAARRDCAAIILESGLSSASDMASVALPWLPRALHVLGRNRFDSVGKISHAHCAVLITHGDADQLVPLEQARALFAAANEPKKLLILPGADHNVFGSLGDKYLDTIADFIREAISSGTKRDRNL